MYYSILIGVSSCRGCQPPPENLKTEPCSISPLCTSLSNFQLLCPETQTTVSLPATPAPSYAGVVFPTMKPLICFYQIKREVF